MSNNLKNNEVLAKNILIRVLAGGISLGAAFSAGKTYLTEPVEVSKEIDDNYESDSNYYQFDDGSIIDLSLTKSKLKKIRELNIDVINTNFNDLKLMPNIEKLELSNFGYLTDEEKTIISSLNNLKEITIRYDTSLANEKCYDLSWIRDDISLNIRQSMYDIYLADSPYGINDIEKLSMYELISNLNNINNNRINVEVYDINSFNETEKWKLALVKIVDSFNFDENTTNEEKIIKIVDYVTKTIEYDSDVINGDEVRAIMYNTQMLKSIFDSKDNYGICCNYAALTAVLAHYSDVNMDYISGTYEGGNHAWCSYDDGNNTYIVDSTFLDSDTYQSKLKDYKENLKEVNKDNLIDDNIIRIDDRYIGDKEIKFAATDDNNTKKNVEFVNTNASIYNATISKTKIDIDLVLIISSVLLLVSNEVYYNKKKNKKI